MENDIFWSAIRSGFGEPGGTPPPRILRSTPPDQLKLTLHCGFWLTCFSYLVSFYLVSLLTLTTVTVLGTLLLTRPVTVT